MTSPRPSKPIPQCGCAWCTPTPTWCPHGNAPDSCAHCTAPQQAYNLQDDINIRSINALHTGTGQHPNDPAWCSYCQQAHTAGKHSKPYGQ